MSTASAQRRRCAPASPPAKRRRQPRQWRPTSLMFESAESRLIGEVGGHLGLQNLHQPGGFTQVGEAYAVLLGEVGQLAHDRVAGDVADPRILARREGAEVLVVAILV